MRVTGYCYPWDVVDDGFADRARDARIDEVAVALAYHSTRAATPWSTRTTAVHAHTAALYRTQRTDGWESARPAAAEWLTGTEDPGAAAVTALNRSGIPALGWLVLTHSSYVGSSWPRMSVVNCLDEHYPWALCPNNPEVQHYVATLAAQAVAGLDLAGVVLEACGQLGVVHQCQHEKTGGVWSPTVIRLLSICCCAHCSAQWSTPRDEVIDLLRREYLSAVHDPSASDVPDEPEGRLAAVLDELLVVRQRGTDTLRARVLDALGDAGGRVVLHASIDPWATGALPGLTAQAARDVDAVVLPAWTPGQATEAQLRQARRLPDITAVGAYVTAVAEQPRPQLPHDVAGLRAAGASELHLYHLGLAGPQRWPHLRAAAHAARAIDTHDLEGSPA